MLKVFCRLFAVVGIWWKAVDALGAIRTRTIFYMLKYSPPRKPTMNEYLFLTLAEKILELYKATSIATDPDIHYSDELRSLIGEIQDAVSCVE